MPNWVWEVFIGGALLIAAIVLWPARFCSDSICTQCGAIRYTTEWQFPGQEWTLFQQSSVKATPLSQYVSSSGLAGPHAHVWLFDHGGGNGVRCALGAGEHLLNPVMSSNLVSLLQSAKVYGGQVESQRWLRLALNRDTSSDVLMMAALVPENGFSSEEQYRTWESENSYLVNDVFAKAEKNP